MDKKRQLEYVIGIDQIPTEYQKRTCTDLFCLIFGIVFSLIMIILALCLYNYTKFYKANFPSDSNGSLCGIDKGMEKYQYVYFVNPPDIVDSYLAQSRRVCVESCPKKGDQVLKCMPTDIIGCRFSNSTGFEVVYYENQPAQTRSGYFCYPKDESLRAQILQKSNLTDRELLYKSLDTIVLCIFVALGFSILYLLAVQFLPKIMNFLAIILGSIIMLVCAICIFTYSTSENVFRILIGILLVLVVIIIIGSFWKNRDSLRIHGIFLNYATKFIKERPGTLIVYIPLFFILLLGLITLIVLQFSAYWTSGDLEFSTQQGLFYRPVGTGPIILTVFLAIQAFWGLVFLKMAFNFCVSGEAVLWYYSRPQTLSYPLKHLICKHLGSVIGGSFIIAFFTIFDFIFDLFKPNESTPNSCYATYYDKICGNYNVFDLVRTDAMSFINLTGNPYCNSARYCEFLCDRSVIMNNSQSTSRVYRLCAHFLMAGIMLIFAMYVKGIISTYALIIIVVNTIFVSTLFISLHADATEAISIIFLADEQLSRRHRDLVPNYGNRGDVLNNLEGVKMRREIVDEIKEERLKQVDKINNRELSRKSNDGKSVF